MSYTDWIRLLGLVPHPEGGFYREVYRADVSASDLPQRYNGPRSLGSSIYFLLRACDRSRFHRLRSDEIWYFHAGGSATVHILTPHGGYEKKGIGCRRADGDSLQVIVPHGSWFGATVDSGDYILVGCAVFPGFDFADFELADQAALIAAYPSHAQIIGQLT